MPHTQTQQPRTLLESEAGSLYIAPAQLAFGGDVGVGECYNTHVAIFACAQFLRQRHIFGIQFTHIKPNYSTIMRLERAPACCARCSAEILLAWRRAGSFALAERARYFNPHCLSSAEKVLVKSYKPGLVEPEDVQVIGGQDSAFIAVTRGAVDDMTMPCLCIHLCCNSSSASCRY